MLPQVVVIGEGMVELNAAEPGSLRTVRQYAVSCGGDALNVAVAVSRLGGRPGLISRVGSDEFGSLLLDLCRSEEVDTTHVLVESSGWTGIYFVARDRDQHSFTYYRRNSAASHLSPADVPEEMVASAQVLYVSGIAQAISQSACDAVSHAIRVARRAQVAVAYDPNVRLKLWDTPEHARQVMLETLASVDILIPSYEDGQFLTGLDAPDKIAEDLLSRGPRAVILKLGGEGVLLMTPEGLKRLAPWRVRCVDTTGAGDTFAGAFLTARVEGRSWGECADFANAAAALSTTGCGAVAPIPKRTQVEAMLASRGDS